MRQTGTAIAQRIRNNVYAGTVSVANRLIRANVNVGTANFPEDHLYPKELMILADQRMQQDRDAAPPACRLSSSQTAGDLISAHTAQIRMPSSNSSCRERASARSPASGSSDP